MQKHPWYPPNTYRVHIPASNGYRYQLVTRNAYFDIFWHNTVCWPAYYMGDSQIAGVWTCSERELHINVLELRAVILALHHWATVLQGRHVLIGTDNTTVVAGPINTSCCGW